MAYFSGRKGLLIPQDPIERERLKAIDEQTKVDVDLKYDIITNQTWHCTTITDTVIRCFVRQLHEDMLQSGSRMARLNFYDVFSAAATIRSNEKAEKEGNLIVFFSPGPVAEDLIKNPVEKNVENDGKKISAFDFFRIEDPDDEIGEEALTDINDYYLALDKAVRYSLSQNYGISLSDRCIYHTFAIAYHYILNIFRRVLQDLEDEPSKNLASLNFDNLIEFHARREEDGYHLYMRTGYQGKLSIKDDNLTEDDGEDDFATPWYRD